MKKTYLSHNFIVFYILLICFSLFWQFYNFFIGLIVYGVIVVLYYHRRNLISVKDSPEMIFSPCYGKIIKIGNGTSINSKFNGFNFIDFRHLPFQDIGLFFPFSSEFSFYRKVEGNRLLLPINRLPKNEYNLHQEIVLVKESVELFFIKIYPNIFTSEAMIYPQSGDYGYLGAEMGVFSGAGIVRFYIPKKYVILCKEGQKVTPSNNILAKK